MAIAQRLETGRPTALSRGACATILLAGLLVGCAKESTESGEIETVDVAPSRTSVLTTLYDDLKIHPRENDLVVGTRPSSVVVIRLL